MRIAIMNKGSRNKLICERADGSTDMADLGPSLPFHDMAHFVVEQKLNIRHGFYGNIYDGYTVQQLGDKHIIKALPADSIAAEIITRALQSLASGACTRQQFVELIEQEFAVYAISSDYLFTEELINDMVTAYQTLITEWEQIKEGEALELEFFIR